MTEFLTFAMMGTASTDGTSSGSGSMSMIIMMVVLFAAMYFFTIRPQKKQQQKEQQLRESTQIGDEIISIGGICGKVVSVKDDSVVIETGADRAKIKFMKYAIQRNVTAEERAKTESDAAKAAMQEKKEKKSKKSKNDEE